VTLDFENTIEIWDEKNNYIMSLPYCDEDTRKIALIAFAQGRNIGFKEGVQFGQQHWQESMNAINNYIKQIKKEKGDIFYE